MGCFYRAMPAVFDPASLAVSARIADLFARIREERRGLRGRMRISMLALQDLLPRGGIACRLQLLRLPRGSGLRLGAAAAEPFLPSARRDPPGDRPPRRGVRAAAAVSHGVLPGGAVPGTRCRGRRPDRVGRGHRRGLRLDPPRRETRGGVCRNAGRSRRPGALRAAGSRETRCRRARLRRRAALLRGARRRFQPSCPPAGPGGRRPGDARRHPPRPVLRAGRGDPGGAQGRRRLRADRPRVPGRARPVHPRRQPGGDPRRPRPGRGRASSLLPDPDRLPQREVGLRRRIERSPRAARRARRTSPTSSTLPARPGVPRGLS